MRRIALTGGIACGKSLVAKYLNELGVETIDADDVVHELLPDPEERRRIAAEVFRDPAKRKALEAKLHPIVKERLTEFLNGGCGICGAPGGRPLPPMTTNLQPSTTNLQPSTFNLQPALRLAIIPLLFEAHWDSEYDIICAVISPREVQLERMMTTRGYSREEAEARIGAQMPVSEKAAKSHYVINNDGTAEYLREQVQKFVNWLWCKSR